MPRPKVAAFVDSFFTRTLFQGDDRLAASVLDAELASDAVININGTTLTALEFVDLITTQFRAAYLATIVDIRDLNIVTTNENESAGVVGQWTIYVTRSKSDGQEIKQSATTIVKVEERNGQSVITGIWEAQTAGEA